MPEMLLAKLYLGWLTHVRRQRELGGHSLLRLRSDHRTGINMFRAKSERLLEAPERKNTGSRAAPDTTTLRPRPATELLAARALMS
jgi:hypothetical protein